VQEVQDKPNNWVRTTLKPEPEAKVEAWKARIEEIKRAMAGVINGSGPEAADAPAQTAPSNPRNFGICIGPTNYGEAAKRKHERQRLESLSQKD
jgi:hypothetical protein